MLKCQQKLHAVTLLCSRCYPAYWLLRASVTDLEAFSYSAELRPSDFDLTPSHVGRLFSVERVRDAAHDEHVQLLASSSFLLLLLRPFRTLLGASATDAAAVRRRQRRARTCRTDAVGSRRMRRGGGWSRRRTDAVEASGHGAADAESVNRWRQNRRTWRCRCPTCSTTAMEKLNCRNTKCPTKTFFEEVQALKQLENVAIAMHFNLQGVPNAAPVIIRFKYDARAKFEVAQPFRCRLAAFLCWYVTLRCDELWLLTSNICIIPAVPWLNSVPDLNAIEQFATELLRFQYST